MGWICARLVLAILCGLLPDAFLADTAVCSFPQQFACKEKCIPISWLCNGDRDCPDGTDEQCDEVCHGDKNAWQCDNGKCISSSWKCDGFSDCLDGSDESECVCAAEKIKCLNDDQCIDAWEVCDGHQDCEGGFDEENCPERKCMALQWQCKNQVCIMESWKCDGIDNCGDGSDEDQCEPCIGDLQCDGHCFNGTQMCDGDMDCEDGTDETNSCDQLCSVANGGCMHQCEEVTWGAKCSCHAGWKIDLDGQSCVDIDECSMSYSPCHQLCRNSNGSFTCDCITGYELKGQTVCEVIDNATLILLAAKAELAIVDVRTGEYQSLVSIKVVPTAIAYDLFRESYYWVDEMKTLHTYVIGGKNYTSLYPDVGSVNSISVDWFTGQLYWASSKNKTISVGLSDGRGYVRIVEKDIVPEQLIVFPNKRYMYWINYGKKGNTTIETAGMDGSDRHVVTIVPMEQPLGLTLDYVASRLYWISEYKESIETIKIDGSGRFTFPDVLQKDQTLLGLAVFEGWFFLANESSLTSVFRNNPVERELLLNTSLISAFTVLHELQQPRNVSPCSPGTCSHLCLLSPVHAKAYKCACPSGQFLLPSGKCENLKIMCSGANEINLLEFGFQGTFLKKTLVQQLLTNMKLMDVDWKRDLVYWTDDDGQLMRSNGVLGSVQVIPSGGPVCLAKVDIPTGNIYWLSCERNAILITRYSGLGTKTVYKSNGTIQHLFLNWEKSFLYVLEDQKMIRRMNLTGGELQDVFNGTAPGFDQIRLDIKSYSLVWSSQFGLYALSLLKGKFLPLKENWSRKLADAYEPYLLSYNDPTIEIWERKTMKIITTIKAANLNKMIIVTSNFVKGSYSLCSFVNGGCMPEEICVTGPKDVVNCLCPDDRVNCTENVETPVDDITFPITPFCPRTFVPCRDGKECVSSDFVCDGEKDCFDGSDEDDCNAYCSNSGIFQCRNGKKCIQERFRCDGVPQCSDASDEQDCWKPTENCALRCDRNVRCVPKSWICDGNPDCFDEADEQGCEHRECSNAKFRCANGQCISYTMHCDGDNDCADHSDELNCTITKPLHCRAGEMRCQQSGECFLKEWQCDGYSDCKDGTDEKDCKLDKITCGKMQWACASEDQCVPDFWHCDGDLDCEDGSDESGCAPKKCQYSKFQCDTFDCIPTTMVCDGNKDCLDGSDEGGKCSLLCEGCSHTCYPSPYGPRCMCEKGFRLSGDNGQCSDINECKEYDPSPCSQSCINANGTYSCACHPGYLLEPDGYKCKVIGSEPVLLIAVQFDLMLLRLRSFEEEIVTSTDKNMIIFSIDYDVLEQKVFWMDLNAESIRWITLDTKAKGTLVKGIKSDCIAIDWVGRNLYWTDGTAGQILATRLNTTWKGYPEYTVILDEDLDQPRSLVLQSLTGLMYWSEIGVQPRIEQAGMDGSQRKILITEQLGWPTGLALDLLSWKIYWSDDKFHCIGSANLDGTDIKVLQLTKIQSPFSLTVFEDEIYWSEIKARTVQKIDKKTGKNWTLVMKRHGQPYGLKVMHEVLQPRVDNPCQNLGCSHLCLIGPGLEGSCWCPMGLLLSNGFNCVAFTDSPFLLMASPTSVTQIYLQKLTLVGRKALPQNKVIPLANVNQLSSIDYVVQDRSLIFAVVNGGYVASTKMKDSDSQDWKIVLSVEDSVISLAVDWITGNLFWISTSKPYIQVASSNGLYKTILINDDLYRPSCISIHPPSSTMCYSDMGSEDQKNNPKIECAFMDGNKRKTIWKKSKMVVGLVFTDSGTRLYWADRMHDTIETMKLDGSKYKVIQIGLHDLDLFTAGEGMLLWTTPSNGTTKVWYSKIEVQEHGWFQVDQRVVDIKLYSKRTQQGSNGCSENNGGCSQICVPNPEGRTCKCSARHRLTSGTLCLEETKCPEGSQPCKDGLKCIPVNKVCDRQADCLDGSDEKSCEYLDKGRKRKPVTIPPPATKGRIAATLYEPTGGFHDEKGDVLVLKTLSPYHESSTTFVEVEDTEYSNEDFGKNMESRPCNTETCNMRGECMVENGAVKCQCMLGYNGDFCENGIKPLAVPLTVGTIGVLLLIAAAAGLFVYVTKRKALQRTLSSASSRTLTREASKDVEEETENFASTETFVNDAFDSEGFDTERELEIPLKLRAILQSQEANL
ncbi:low-density lipoprotein receptor-related protein 2-like [Ascaphus truei]|uniref:low-density lipoprotein receptor-related protein 2-like n=1 Tax=Ascaphus truei TaxID=8439 RepID=UPI003F596602